MRPIKFRAWDKANVSVYSSQTDPKRMSFYGPNFVMDDNQNTLNFLTPEGSQSPFGDHGSMERYILMQSTDIVDKNEKEIFEGDVVRLPGWKPGEYQIVFIEGAFCLGSLEKNSAFEIGDYVADIHYVQSGGRGPTAEIIGNIYANPELIKNI